MRRVVKKLSENFKNINNLFSSLSGAFLARLFPKGLLLLAGFVAAPWAMADGFICSAPTESLEVRVFNRTRAEEGTRNVAVMVLSDPSKPFGKRTLARFSADAGELSNQGTVFTAPVNPRPFAVPESVMGVRLGQLHEVILRVDFSYRRPVKHGDIVSAVLELNSLNGDQLWVDMDCERYLKSSSF